MMGIDSKITRLSEGHSFDGLPFVATKIGVDSLVYSETPVDTAAKAVALVSDRIYNETRELGIAIYLDSENIPICLAQVGLGDEKGSVISARDIVQIGLLSNASGLILVHNHPTLVPDARNLKASDEDIHLADTLAKACGLHGILLYDSVIVSGFKEKLGVRIPAYYSMKEHNFYKLSKKAGSFDFESKSATKEEDIAWGEKGSEIWNSKVSGMTESHIEDYEFSTGEIEGVDLN